MLFHGNQEIDFNTLTVQYASSQSFPCDPNEGSSETFSYSYLIGFPGYYTIIKNSKFYFWFMVIIHYYLLSIICPFQSLFIVKCLFQIQGIYNIIFLLQISGNMHSTGSSFDVAKVFARLGFTKVELQNTYKETLVVFLMNKIIGMLW